jgi:hypothetical protein
MYVNHSVTLSLHLALSISRCHLSLWSEIQPHHDTAFVFNILEFVRTSCQYLCECALEYCYSYLHLGVNDSIARMKLLSMVAIGFPRAPSSSDH